MRHLLKKNFTLLILRLHERVNLESRKSPLCCKVATYCHEVAQCIEPQRLSSRRSINN